jgi:hypothetical protein
MPHPAPAHRSFADRNSLYQQITDKIIAELEQGRVPCPWPAATCAYPPSANQMRTAASGLAEPKSLRTLRWRGESAANPSLGLMNS